VSYPTVPNQRAEEKQRHRDIIRRMRDGYDGRRGGIASGNAARGTIRFDELVAADNRDDAKRLGLLNDDELNSEDEEEGGDGKGKKKGDEEDDDEAVQLDKMLKERYLNKEEEDAIEENFTDDEDSGDEADKAEKNNGHDDDEDREQDRLAKHFAKRARRNRILEEFTGDSQFSRSRLIDEDVTMQQDLKTMKTSLCRKRSMEGSNLDLKENNCSSKKTKGTSADKNSDAPKATSSFLSHEGSLSVALMASRRTMSRKRKTTFLSGMQQRSSSSRNNHSSTSSSSKSVSLNHVVFMAGDNSQSATAGVSQLDSASSSSQHSFLGAVKSSSRGHSKSRNGSKNVSRGSSLWSKVCSKNFRA